MGSQVTCDHGITNSGTRLTNRLTNTITFTLEHRYQHLHHIGSSRARIKFLETKPVIFNWESFTLPRGDFGLSQLRDGASA